MHSIRDEVSGRRRRQDLPSAARAVLFPELAGRRTAFLAPGLLRAPPRGRAPAPCLSAYAPEAIAVSVPANVATPGRLLAERGWEELELLVRAAAVRRELVAARVGGNWWLGGGDGESLLESGHALVVLNEPALVDREPLAADDVAATMLDTAFLENPARRIVVSVPGSIGPSLRHSLAAARARGAVVIDRALDPWVLLDHAERVYSAGGETGFLALIAGVPVTTFAASYYSGWGATDDVAGVPRHAFPRTVDEIFAGVCLVATRYLDPFRNTITSFEEALAILAEWRRLDEVNRRIAVCVGMSFWKRRRIAEFVRSSAGEPQFHNTVDGALAAARGGSRQRPGAIAGWASRLPDGLAEAAIRADVPLIRVEDGFIRSVGLGSDFLPPASLVFDASGMYYDPRQESDLERLLLEADFPTPLLARAEQLAAQLVTRGITKYNLAAGDKRLDLPAGRRRILVPGQVEDDLSIRFGAGAVRTNLELLARVRAANPAACIIYKPHPDVLAGHRVGAVPEAEVRRFADILVPDGATASLLAVVDELHTMTSLAGFEALLRGRRVVVYGRPFYAGWGLTTDVSSFNRGRPLSLTQLVAGTLILYPRYLDPLTRLPCGPEIVIDRLDRPELWRPGPLVLARRLQGAALRRLHEFRATLAMLRPGPRRDPASGLRERPRP